MNAPTQTRRLLLRLKIALALGLLLSGCVYLRLLRFKAQLERFDQYVAVEQREDRMIFLFREPVLRGEDLVFLAGAEPQRVEALEGGAERWIWLFRKRPAPEETSPLIVPIATRIESGMLAAAELDETALEAIPAPWILTIARRVGEARIDRKERRASLVVRADRPGAPPTPTMEKTMRTAGPPTKIQEGADGQPTRYVYTLVSYEPDKGENEGRFEVAFLLDEGDPSRPILGYKLNAYGR